MGNFKVVKHAFVIKQTKTATMSCKTKALGSVEMQVLVHLNKQGMVEYHWWCDGRHACKIQIQSKNVHKESLNKRHTHGFWVHTSD